MKLAGIERCTFTTARVSAGSHFDSASYPAATARSQPSSSDAPPAEMRRAWIWSWRVATRTWLVTAPNFCARPVMSSTDTPLPSMCAAIPSSAPTVTTPLPPMPVTRMFHGSSSAGSAGSGRRRSLIASGAT